MPAKNHQGFSLIEILIVLVIIGIALSFALLAFGDFGAERRVLAQARYVQHNLALLQQQAVFENTSYAMRIEARRYVFMQWANDRWQIITRGPFKPHESTSNLVLRLRISSSLNLILVQASGNMTPFHLDFGTSQTMPMATLIGMENGTMKLEVVSQ